MTTVRIPLMRSTFFDEEQTRQRLADFILTAPRLSQGHECAEFEKSFSLYQERAHSVLVSNGSAANLGLIQALLNLGRLKKGDRVGISAVTWSTNVMPLLQLGLTPVAIDCSIDHLNITSAELQKHMKNLSALFITNALGFCGDLDVIVALCNENDVLLLEDNCESLGTQFMGKLLGSFGLASTFSFFVGHHLSTIEGGMICTDDEELADMLLMVRAHGWDRNLSPEKQQALRTKHHVSDFNARYTFYESAFNIRATEITGFLGRLQLPMLEETIVKRETNFRAFKKATDDQYDHYHPLKTSHIERISNFAMPVLCRSPEMREQVITRFENAGIETRPTIAGDITQHPFWTASQPISICSNAALIHTQGLYLPNNPDLTENEIQEICNLLQYE